MKNILLLILISFTFCQYNFSLEDLNPNSATFGEEVGPSNFLNQVTLIYFGHFN